ncbi:MAG: ATP-binding protein [Solobacterium sp.]|nr:ATP-binding protein [Solobacterium sp.]
MEITLDAKVENVQQVTAFIDEELEKIDCPLKAQTQIDVAVDELFSNIAMYAYAPSIGTATVQLEIEDDPRAVVITFIDQGKPYNPLEKDDPDVTLSAEDRQIGGLGIFLVKKTMDDMTYRYEDGKNIVSIKKMI